MIGSASPCDDTATVDAASPAWTRMLRTVMARFSPSAMFAFGSPIVSVCPTIATSGTGSALTAAMMSGIIAVDASVRTSDSNLNCSVKWRGAGGSAASAAPKTRATSSSPIVVTAPGAAAAVATDAARGAARSVDPNSLDTRARPVTRVSGSGSRTTSVGSGGGGCSTAGARFAPHPAVNSSAASAGRKRGGRRRTASLRPHANSDRSAANADDRRGRLEPDGVRRELGDAPRDVDGNAPGELQDHAQAPFGRRVDVPIDPHLAVRPERDPGVVAQRNPQRAAGRGAQDVAGEHRVARAGRDGGALADHEGPAGDRFDVPRGRRLLRRRGAHRRQDEREDAAEPLQTAHEFLQRRKFPAVRSQNC